MRDDARRRERRHADHLLKTGKVLPAEDVNDKEVEVFARAVRTNNIAQFGLVKLSKLAMNHVFVTLEDADLRGEWAAWDTSVAPKVSLLTLATLLGKHVIVGALLRGGAWPGVTDSGDTTHPTHDHKCGDQDNHQNRSDVLSLAASYIRSYRPMYGVWITRELVRMRLRAQQSPQQPPPHCHLSVSPSRRSDVDGDRETSGRGGGSPHLVDRPLQCGVCSAIYCEWCFWRAWVTRSPTVREEWRCPHCNQRVRHSLPTPSDVPPQQEAVQPELRREQRLASLESFKLLPDVEGPLPPRPPFQPMDLEEVCELFAGLTKGRRCELFHKAVGEGDLHRIAALFRLGVDVDGLNEYEHTPLFSAVMAGRAAVVEQLLAWDADPTVSAPDGSTCLTIACTNQHDHILLMLATQVAARTKGVSVSRESSAGDVQQLAENHLKQIQASCSTRHPPLPTMGGKDEVTAATVDARSSIPIINPTLKVLIPKELDHPGSGAFIIDGAFSPAFMRCVDDLWPRLPEEQQSQVSAKRHDKKASSCAARIRYCDAERWVAKHIVNAIAGAIQVARKEGVNVDSPEETYVSPHMRFLHYRDAGGSLARHVDLSKALVEKGVNSTHTFVIYVETCDEGGATMLMEHLTTDGGAKGKGKQSKKVQEKENEKDIDVDNALALVQPVRGRLLVFPHETPHQGQEVVDTPKLLLRGEMLMKTSSNSRDQSAGSVLKGPVNPKTESVL